jgi:hypothetical protein
LPRIVQIFRWGKKRRFVPPSVVADIEDINRLQRGRTAAPETNPITPAPLAYAHEAHRTGSGR